MLHPLVERGRGGSREKIEEEPDSDFSDSQGEDGVSTRTSRYKLSLEEVEDLLGAIHATLEIQEEKDIVAPRADVQGPWGV